MTDGPTPTHDLAFLEGGGEMGALIRSHDWSTSPLGHPATWPQSLRSALGMVLASPFPMMLAWGRELVTLHNDAYLPFLDDKPRATGRPLLDVWAEVRDTIAPLFERALAGEACRFADAPFTILRRGKPEEAFFDFSLSPVRDDAGAVAGVLNVAVETTERTRTAAGRACAEAELRAHAARQTFRLKFEERLREFADPDMIKTEALALLGEHLGADRVGYSEIIDDAIVRTAGSYVANGMTPLNGDFPIESFGEAMVARQRQGITEVSDDVLLDPERKDDVWAAIDTRSVVSVPLVRDGRFVALLYVNNRGPRRWPHEDVALIEEVAARTWDATQRARAEAKLTRSEERLRAIFETARDYAIFTTDAEGRIETWPAGAQEVFGWTAAEAIGQSVDMTFTPEDRAYGAPEVERITARAARLAPNVRWHLRKDGVRVFIEGVTRPLDNQDGSPAGFVKVGQDVTNRRRAEEQLQLATEAAALGIFDVDFTTGVMEWNARQRELWGVGPDEVITDEIFLAGIHLEDRERVQALLAKAFEPEGDGLYAAEFRLLPREDGRECWIAARGRVHFDAHHPVRLIGTVQDITARKRTEDALRQSEARLRFLDSLGRETARLQDADLILATTTRMVGEHLGVSICAYADMDDDEDGFTIRGDWAAAGSASIIGHYSLADFGALAVRNLGSGQPLIVNDNLAELAPNEAATFRAIGIAATICMPLVKEGRLTALMAIHDKAPRVWTEDELAVIREVTERSWAHVERVRSEQALRASEARLRLAVKAGQIGEWELDVATDTSVRAFRHDQIFGYDESVEDWGFESFIGHVVPEDRSHVEAAFRDAAETGTGWHFECRIRRANDGELRWIAAHSEPQLGPDGKVQRLFGLVQDITEQRRAQDQLRELNETLESRVAERTAELEQAHEQLRQSQKLEAMGQLTGGVAHDFNNLLTPIIGSLDMLTLRGVGNERERRLIDGALQSAERAKTLVQRLLAFARRQPLQPGPVDVRGLVSGMAELVASTTGPKVEVRVEMPDDLPPATADANQLEMAVLNLAVNARDAMPDGGALTITGSRESVRAGHPAKLRPGHYVRLSVSDTGVGMDEVTLARAIEPFFSTKGVGRGTGLGLSMVHGLALQLNGGLTIASRPGEGTTVELWLPISAVAADDEDQILGDAVTRKALGTALLVDDEVLVRMSTADMLADLGYEVVEAGSAEEVLRLIGEGLEPDLLVTDHLMPGMSGEKLARKLRLSRPALPILIVSGYAEAAGIAPGLPRLTKPFRSAELAARVAGLQASGAH